MVKTTLGEFTTAFLTLQGVPNFSLTFEPMYDRAKVRRAKRSTAMVEARKDAEDVARLQGSKTVADLIERFHSLVPESRMWTAGPARYAVRLYDEMGQVVHMSATLADIRKGESLRLEAARAKVTKLIASTLTACDRLLIREEIVTCVNDVLQEKYPDLMVKP